MSSAPVLQQSKIENNIENASAVKNNAPFIKPLKSVALQINRDKRAANSNLKPQTTLKSSNGNKKGEPFLDLYGCTKASKTSNSAKISDYLRISAQEPWPKDVQLFQPYEVEQILLPDNANCLATQAFLKMCGLDFKIEQRKNAEFMSPTGKVPFIRAGAFVISEFEGIVQFVNGKGITLTGHLEPEQKSDMRAYMSLVHNVLENAELYICWCDPETYREVTKPRNGSVYPWPLNHIQTWSKKNQSIKRLKIFGWYSKTLTDVYQEVETCCQALTDRLENKEYFFGNKFTECDALIYGHVKALVTRGLTRDLYAGSIVAKYDNLLEHCRRIDSVLFNRETDFSSVITTKEIKTEICDKLKPCSTLSPNMSSITLTESVVSESEIAAGDSAAETTVTLTNSGRVNVHMTTKK